MAPKRSSHQRLAVLVGLLLVCGRAGASDDARAWWSLQPLQRPAVPTVESNQSAWIKQPIDAFIAARLNAHGLRPAPEASRRTLLRRLCFTVTGLPPTPEVMEAFLRDPDPLAYEKCVDQLLESPAYGERWARHWLDVVHYGDTHGYDKDKPRPNAWPYRDYVVRAFNEDKPYSRFIEEQIAGDILYPNTVDGVEALGFIATGPWDFIGHAEVVETKIDGQIARHLDRDDMVANTINTFNSLTVQCAQCHDHKFDPITQQDYYNLQTVFAALDRADKNYDHDPAVSKQRHALERDAAHWTQEKRDLEEKISQWAGPELAELDQKIKVLGEPAKDSRPLEFGYHSQIAPNQNVSKWVQVDLGTPTSIHALAFVPCHDDFNGIGSGFGFPLRFKIQASSDATFSSDLISLLDKTREDVPNPGVAIQKLETAGQRARYVRITATKLAPRQNDFIFALSELEVYDQRGSNVALRAAVRAADSIEAPPRWGLKNLTDGLYPGQASTARAAERARLDLERRALVQGKVEPATRDRLAKAEEALTQVKQGLAALPEPSRVYAGTVYHGSGAFRGTGPEGGKPRPIHVLARGDVTSPGPEAKPAALNVFAHYPGALVLAADHKEGDRRAALAHWLSHERNPLTWRSIVNRVWLYHFGRGMVDSPNDFGRMGQAPSHPELLDWLAVEFRDGGQSFKRLHRLILTSATFRQSSSVADAAGLAKAEATDADNTLLWHMHRRRLEAESIRDSVLSVSGTLDRRMGGPGFQDFTIEKPEHSPHYQYHLHDPEDAASHRRAIYRFIVRSQQQPFMTTLNCADPSMRVDKRTESLSALQALAMLNNDFMLAMSKHFAASLESWNPSLESQIARAFYLALGRPPEGDESMRLQDYARHHGLPNACRLLFNLNEFVFVD